MGKMLWNLLEMIYVSVLYNMVSNFFFADFSPSNSVHFKKLDRNKN